MSFIINFAYKPNSWTLKSNERNLMTTKKIDFLSLDYNLLGETFLMFFRRERERERI